MEGRGRSLRCSLIVLTAEKKRDGNGTIALFENSLVRTRSWERTKIESISSRAAVSFNLMKCTFRELELWEQCGKIIIKFLFELSKKYSEGLLQNA